ncbi:MAG TPA: hypothetical protein VH482_37620 [Thermomicrobiales bacterium]|jgi:hypothetical protein
MRFRFRFASPYDLDECQRRIWLLNATTVAIRNRGALTCIARAYADEAGFAVWTINLVYAGRVTESALAVRGRWWADGAVTRVEARLVPRPMFGASILAVLGALGLYGCARVLRIGADQDALAAWTAPVLAGGIVAFAILAIVAAQEQRALAWDRLIEETLRAPAEPDGGENGRKDGTSRRARRRRARRRTRVRAVA